MSPKPRRVAAEEWLSEGEEVVGVLALDRSPVKKPQNKPSSKIEFEAMSRVHLSRADSALKRVNLAVVGTENCAKLVDGVVVPNLYTKEIDDKLKLLHSLVRSSWSVRINMTLDIETGEVTFSIPTKARK